MKEQHLDDHTVPEVLAADEWSSVSPPILQPLTKSSPTNPASPQASNYELVPLVAHLCFCQMTAWKLESNSSLATAAVTCFHLSCRMERCRIKEKKNLLQHLVHVAQKQVVESPHCHLGWVSQGCQSGRPMSKLFTKDPQPRALPRAARPLLDRPRRRLLHHRNGALANFHSDT